jgi:hypothetical protein
MRSFDECVTTSIAAPTDLRRSLRFGAAPSRGPCSIHAKPMCIFVSAENQRTSQHPVMPQTWPSLQATRTAWAVCSPKRSPGCIFRFPCHKGKTRDSVSAVARDCGQVAEKIQLLGWGLPFCDSDRPPKVRSTSPCPVNFGGCPYLPVSQFHHRPLEDMCPSHRFPHPMSSLVVKRSVPRPSLRPPLNGGCLLFLSPELRVRLSVLTATREVSGGPRVDAA